MSQPICQEAPSWCSVPFAAHDLRQSHSSNFEIRPSAANNYKYVFYFRLFSSEPPSFLLTLSVNRCSLLFSCSTVCCRVANCPHVGQPASNCGHWLRYPWGPDISLTSCSTPWTNRKQRWLLITNIVGDSIHITRRFLKFSNADEREETEEREVNDARLLLGKRILAMIRLLRVKYQNRLSGSRKLCRTGTRNLEELLLIEGSSSTQSAQYFKILDYDGAFTLIIS